MSKIKKLEEIPLSDRDLRILLSKFGVSCTICKYSGLAKFKTLDELLGKNRCAIILYETRQNFGHWVCVFENGNNHIEFFDSYGYFPDDERDFVPTAFRKVGNIDYPYLTYLLYDSNKHIHYNEYQLQEKGNNVNTCGRHVATRLAFKNIPHRKYISMINKIKKEMTPDFFVTIFTHFYI